MSIAHGYGWIGSKDFLMHGEGEGVALLSPFSAALPRPPLYIEQKYDIAQTIEGVNSPP